MVVAKDGLWFCGARQNFHVVSVWNKPDQHDRIYDCLLSPMAIVHAEDVHASFLIEGVSEWQPSGIAAGFYAHE